MEMTNEELNIKLFDKLPRHQKDRVFSSKWCDIEPGFMGFLKIYKFLSDIIPKHWTVVDLGCAYNPQSFYFTEHKRFIAVDNFSGVERFLATGTEFYEMSIECFIEKHLDDLFLDETFAICSYVPPWGADNMKLVRESFKNVFTYYPHGG